MGGSTAYVHWRNDLFSKWMELPKSDVLLWSARCVRLRLLVSPLISAEPYVSISVIFVVDCCKWRC